MVLGAATLFAVNGTASKMILQAGIAPQQLTLIRAIGAGCGLLLLAAPLPGRRLRLTRRELPLLLALGLTGFFLTPMLYFIGIAHIPVGVALLIEFIAPVFVALWARFGQRHHVRPRLWAGLA